MADDFLSALLRPPAVRRSIFVSYHHDGDQAYYSGFSDLFSNYFGIVRDNSLNRFIDSDDPEYVMRRIREYYITGTSCTVVLCGSQTRWRKYVDWEIKATLDKEHGLIGVNLPDNPLDRSGRVHKPDRLQDNINSGYAVWIGWTDLSGGPTALRAFIETAILKPAFLIDNSRPLRRRNGL